MPPDVFAGIARVAAVHTHTPPARARDDAPPAQKGEPEPQRLALTKAQTDTLDRLFIADPSLSGSLHRSELVRGAIRGRVLDRNLQALCRLGLIMPLPGGRYRLTPAGKERRS